VVAYFAIRGTPLYVEDVVARQTVQERQAFPMPAQQSQHPRLLRIRSRLMMAGDPAAGRLRADFG
jgi:hypothetical protein